MMARRRHVKNWSYHLELKTYLAFAREVAHEGGRIAVKQFRHSHVRRKADGTLVTQTDELIDRYIADKIAATFADHRVLSEEQSTHFDPGYPFSWVVDPVDGTTNFARGLPVWGISVALLYEGAPLLGVVNFPLVGEEFWAVRTQGAWRSGIRIQTNTDAAPDDEQLLMKCTRTERQFALTTPLKSRVMGSAAYHLCKVADGTALAAIETTPKVWDLAAAHLIVQEAGGVINSVGGAPIFPLPAAARDYGAVAWQTVAAASPAIMEHLCTNMRVAR